MENVQEYYVIELVLYAPFLSYISFSFSPSAAPILPPTNVQVQFTGPKSFTVAWDPPPHPVLSYTLAYSGGNVQIPGDRTHAQVVSRDTLDSRRFTLGLYSQTSAGFSTTDAFSVLYPGDPSELIAFFGEFVHSQVS